MNNGAGRKCISDFVSIMSAAFEAVWETKMKYNTDMRTGAFILAIERIVSAMRGRGWL